MGWTAWILASAFLLALYDLAKKASVRDNAVLPVLLCSATCGCAAFVAALAAAGRLPATFAAVDGRVLALGAAKSAIVSVSWMFTFCALRTLPITIATPIRASAPALVFAVALFAYGEVPSAAQAVGMALVFAGYWAFSWAGSHEGVDFRHSRAVWCAFAGMALSAGSALFDKFVFQVANAPVEPVQLVFQAGVIVVYAAAFAAVRAVPALRGGRAGRAFSWRWTIPFVGGLLMCADWLYFRGLAIPDVPVSVCSLLRRFSVAITFAVGAVVFRETNLRRKSIALLLVLAGVALLCLGR